MKKLLFTCAILCATVANAQSYKYPFQNPTLTSEQRADDLLGRLTIEEKASLMMDVSPAIERLGIPHFEWWNEALHGVGRNGFATVFPITMGMAASWDDALLYKVFTAVRAMRLAPKTKLRSRKVVLSVTKDYLSGLQT